jgi:hypothetical protein
VNLTCVCELKLSASEVYAVSESLDLSCMSHPTRLPLGNGKSSLSANTRLAFSNNSLPPFRCVYWQVCATKKLTHLGSMRHFDASALLENCQFALPALLDHSRSPKSNPGNAVSASERRLPGYIKSCSSLAAHNSATRVYDRSSRGQRTSAGM